MSSRLLQASRQVFPCRPAAKGATCWTIQVSNSCCADTVNLANRPPAVVVGYLTEHEGARMAELYHQYLNPGIALLDPYRTCPLSGVPIFADSPVHSFTYLREHSALLLSAVLAVTAKFFHKELYPRLGSHSQRLISRAVEQGTCTTAIVQAILIMVYWKEPRDTSAWIKIGLAIRMGYQLGFHTGNIPDTPLDDELALREKLDRERTWFGELDWLDPYQHVLTI